MNFEPSFEQISVTAEQEQLPQDKKEIIEELEKIDGNKLYFKEYGSDDKSEAILNPEVLNGLSEEAASFVESALECFKEYLVAPVFTDDFHEDHPSRRQWEEENIMVGTSSPARQYYDSNRLNIHMFYPAMEYLKDICEEIADGELQNNLRILQMKIPADLVERVEYSQEEKPIIKFCLLPDKQKVKAIADFTKIIEEAVDLLEKK